MFILDFGSGNTCQNDIETVKKMIMELNAVDTRKENVIIKWQLFTKAGDNIPLQKDVFKEAYNIASDYGYKTTASVFDTESLEFLLGFDIPFVKLANNKKAYELEPKIPNNYIVLKSVKCKPSIMNKTEATLLCCVSNYPAAIEDYIRAFDNEMLSNGISDHTDNWFLYRYFKPKIYECHYKLIDSVGLDAGVFARTPQDLMAAL